MKFLLAIILNISFLNANDVYLKAMKDEIERNTKNLVMEGFSAPYFLVYTNYDNDYCEVSLSFGDVEYKTEDRMNVVKSEVRVGNRKFDSSNYAGDLNKYTPYYTYLPQEPDYDAIRQSLWYLTDEAYKNAIDLYSKKEGYRKNKDIKEIYDEISDSPKVEYIKKDGRFKENCSKYEKILKEISALSKKYDKIKSSSVRFYHSYETKRYADSENSFFITSYPIYSVSITAEIMDKNGFVKKTDKKFIFDSDRYINESLVKKADSFLKEVSDTYNSEVLDYYLGPAVFEEDAAGEFFNNLFVRNISFYPPVETDKEEYLKYYYDVPKLVDRIGKRVISGFIDIYDDPTVKEYEGEYLAGNYYIDDEAVIAKKLNLVENGVLKNIYTSKRPNKYSSQSNGHARGGYYMYNYPTSGNVFINSKKTLKYEDLILEAKKMAKEQNMANILVVRKLSSSYTDDVLGEPSVAYLLDINTGEKKYISDSKFEGMGLRSLRDIVYTEDKKYVYNFEQKGPFYNSQSVNSSIIAPKSILINEIELIKSDKKPDKKPYVPHPYFNK